MTEGGLLKTLFDFTLTSITDYAHESKFLQELEANGTNIEEYFNKTYGPNGTSATGQMSEYDRRYNERYGYRPHGYGGYPGGYGYGGGNFNSNSSYSRFPLRVLIVSFYLFIIGGYYGGNLLM